MMIMMINRPDIVILGMTMKEAYLIDVGIPNSQYHIQETQEIYRPKRRANKNVTTECSLYSATSLIHNMYFSR